MVAAALSTTIMVLGALAVSLLAVALAEMARRDTRREAAVIAADVTRAAAVLAEARNCVSAARTHTATCQEHAGTCAEAARAAEASAERSAVPLAAALLRAGAESLEAAEAAARETVGG